jgi:preprotein translocase subunit SecG
MSFLIGLLTVVLVLNCLLLILLVLIQLPKKDAGAGLAFGGAATDALFGAGTGNVLTKVTKYATVVFFLLAMVLSVMQSKYYHSDTREFQRQVERAGKQPPPAGQPAPASTPPLNPAVGPETSNALALPLIGPTNPPPAPK